MDSDLVAALRSRGVTVITALDAGLIEKSDDEQLAFAAEHGCVTAGSVVYVNSNEEHGWKNPGPERAQYFVMAIGREG
jgi:hypothetical protein